MARGALLPALLVLSLAAPRAAVPQGGTVRDLVAQLSAPDAAARAQAACGLKRAADQAADAIAPLTALLADASRVDGAVCGQWSHRRDDFTTTPGEQAAAALVAIGTRAFQPLLTALQQPAWVGRRNAAWALGALDDRRAVPMLRQALGDREPGVREQAAWALGAIDADAAAPALAAALEDVEATVREQAAWALGAIGNASALDALVRALRDDSTEVRAQAAWALGAIGDSRATAGLIAALKDDDVRVRRQAAWAIGAIGK